MEKLLRVIKRKPERQKIVNSITNGNPYDQEFEESTSKKENGTDGKKKFRNPSGYWEHRGGYSILLVNNTLKDGIPLSATVEDNKVTVTDGRIKQRMGGIQFYSREEPFAWPYICIKEIRNAEGDLLWQNWGYT